MKTITVNLYEFNELNKEAKKKAIEDWRKYSQETGDYLFCFNDQCTEKAEEKGFFETKFQWSLSWSQGDGLSFSAKKYNNLESLFLEILGKGKEKTSKLLAENCTIIIKGNNGHYCFASKSDIDLYIENYNSSINCVNINNIDKVIEKVLHKLEDIYINLCKELEKYGYDDIKYQDSDEAIIETIQCNEYDFTENGEIY